MGRYLMPFILAFVLKQHAWYAREEKELNRLYDYIFAGNSHNVQHMSQAGLFKANLKVSPIEVEFIECSENVKFRFKDEEVWHYTRIEEIADL
jgi:hypothetical protein